MKRSAAPSLHGGLAKRPLTTLHPKDALPPASAAPAASASDAPTPAAASASDRDPEHASRSAAVCGATPPAEPRPRPALHDTGNERPPAPSPAGEAAVGAAPGAEKRRPAKFKTPFAAGASKAQAAPAPAPSAKVASGPVSATVGGSAASTSAPAGEPDSRYFKVLHTKMSKKKHKTFDDGVLIVKGNRIVLKDMEGGALGQTASYSLATLRDLGPGSTLSVGGKELEVVEPIPADEFLSGNIFLKQALPAAAAKGAASGASVAVGKKFKSHTLQAPGVGGDRPAASAPHAPGPRFNPDAPGALVLFRGGGKTDRSGRPLVDVVVDPILSSNMRAHQREGVQFMFECVMGLRDDLNGGTGCILADEMGLGKTLQAIALVWTLLKQGLDGLPVVSPRRNEKVIVVTPSSLVQNWCKEFKKWLGSARLKPLSIGESSKDTAAQTVQKFKESSTDVHPLLVISYEQFRQHAEVLQSVHCGLVICDEGHRLKNSAIKTSQAITGLSTTRRVILSGTPIQNDLEEFFAMCEFCNPGLLGTLSSFKKNFIAPILQSRETGASRDQKLEGEARSRRLTEITANFILRRTSSVLENYLPPKVEQVVLCLPSALQLALYRQYLRGQISSILGVGNTTFALDCINSLKKLCNHPALVQTLCDPQKAAAADDDESTKGFAGCSHLFPDGFDRARFQPEFSGKMAVLDAVLDAVRSSTQDKVVLVSNSTKSLDYFELMCTARDYRYLRLDGSTPQTERQRLVDRFNGSDARESFLFLLSAKAGGVGLNLIGANRLILFDPDWNPAVDRQAMARVWRDGQKKKVWLYRLLTTGTIEEKIFQRQVTKQGLSNAIVDSKTSDQKAMFSKEDLKDVFMLHEDTLSDTHDLLACQQPCCTSAVSDGTTLQPVTTAGRLLKKKSAQPAKKECVSELASWKHASSKSQFLDPLLQALPDSVCQQSISFVFANELQPTADSACVSPSGELDDLLSGEEDDAEDREDDPFDEGVVDDS